MSSKIEQLIDEIEEYIDGCKYQTLSNTKIIVNKEEIDELLRELRMKTPDEIKRYQKIISNKEAILNDAKEKAEALALSHRLRELTLVVTATGGGAGRLFGSVTNQEIAVALKEKAGIELDKRKIVISDTIKSVGTYTVTCKLGYEISAPLTVKIEEA